MFLELSGTVHYATNKSHRLGLMKAIYSSPPAISMGDLLKKCLYTGRCVFLIIIIRVVSHNVQMFFWLSS